MFIDNLIIYDMKGENNGKMNLSDEQMNKIMKNASKKTGVDVEKMKSAAKSGKLDDFIGKNLSPDASKKLKSVLTDKSAAEKLLSTPEAKELLKNLLKG